MSLYHIINRFFLFHHNLNDYQLIKILKYLAVLFKVLSFTLNQRKYLPGEQVCRVQKSK
jgi:hypothetical protein